MSASPVTPFDAFLLGAELRGGIGRRELILHDARLTVRTRPRTCFGDVLVEEEDLAAIDRDIAALRAEERLGVDLQRHAELARTFASPAFAGGGRS